MNNTYGLLTKCEVKMAGYWPSSFFACLWTEMESRSNKHAKKKKRTRPISSHLKTTSLVNKGFIIWLSGKFCLRTLWVVPSGQDSSIFPARIANHSAGFDSSCPLTEPYKKNTSLYGCVSKGTGTTEFTNLICWDRY